MPFDNWRELDYCVRCEDKKAKEWVASKFATEELKRLRALCGIKDD